MEFITRHEDGESGCERKNARLTRVAKDCFEVGIVNEDFIFDEVDFYSKKTNSC